MADIRPDYDRCHPLNYRDAFSGDWPILVDGKPAWIKHHSKRTHISRAWEDVLELAKQHPELIRAEEAEEDGTLFGPRLQVRGTLPSTG